MRARTHGSRFLSALAAGALLGACGSGLYDATGVPKLANGGGTTCDPNNANAILCTVDGVPDTCTDSNVSHCGASCASCTATAPANAVTACLGVGAAAVCGYTCTDGFLKCAGGCCSATAIAAAEQSTCALLSSGEVACWGANDAGQVGDGTTTAAQTAPKLVSLGSSATAVATGGSHACAVVANGAVKCWGKNDQGQVTGTTSGAAVLSPADTPVTSGATAVAVGAAHTCALLANQTVTCWGSNASGQLSPTPSGAAAISAGRNHTCAVAGGAVRCWGSNASGQLGGSTQPAIASGIQSVAVGADQACASTGTSNSQSVDDALRCWGDSVGDAAADVNGWFLASPQTTPAIPMKRTGSSAQSTIRFAVDFLAVGGHHVCVHRAGEFLECFGANDRGQLGGALLAAGETVTVTLPAAAAAIAAGVSHTCSVLTDGRIRCWGANDAGQLGNESTADAASPVAPSGK